MSPIWLSLLFGAPWLVPTIWIWSRLPRTDDVPPSLANASRQRLWST
jgi:hypothetical protein